MSVSLVDGVLFVTYFILLFFSIFWMIVLFTTKEEDHGEVLQEKSKFTVIIPAWNEERSIIGTLQSVVNLDYPRQLLEIIVVNDGSTDSTRSKVEQFITQNKETNIILINQDNAGKGRALNVGLEQATGEYFACLDADSFIASNAIKRMLPIFQKDKRIAAVCPLMKVKRPKTVLQKVQWVEYTINMFYKWLNSKLDCIHVTPGPFSVYRTKVIKDLGGYDEETITEDLEIAIRLQKYNYRIVQTFKTTVETIAPVTWKHLFNQRVRWYRGSVDNTIKYKELMFNRKYGDFGMVRMPTIILSGALAIVVAIVLGQSVFVKGFEWFKGLQSINFDIFTLIRNYSPSINLLSLPYFKLAIAGTLLAISLIVMVLSYKLVKEKITNYGKTWLSLISYMTIYGLFLTVVWCYIGFMIVTKRSKSW